MHKEISTSNSAEENVFCCVIEKTNVMERHSSPAPEGIAQVGMLKTGNTATDHQKVKAKKNPKDKSKASSQDRPASKMTNQAKRDPADNATDDASDRPEYGSSEQSVACRSAYAFVRTDDILLPKQIIGQ